LWPREVTAGISQPFGLEALLVVGGWILEHLAAEHIRPLVAALVGQLLAGEEDRRSIDRAVNRRRIEPRLNRAPVHDLAVGVVVVIAGADEPSLSPAFAEVVAVGQSVGGLLNHLRRADAALHHDVVVVEHVEVL
jgi:hypothetical protein